MVRLTVVPHSLHLPFDRLSSPGHQGNHLGHRIRLLRRLVRVGGAPPVAPLRSCCRSRHLPRRIGSAQRIVVRTAPRRIVRTGPMLAWHSPLLGAGPIQTRRQGLSPYWVLKTYPQLVDFGQAPERERRS